jgi:hypothetical protein
MENTINRLSKDLQFIANNVDSIAIPYLKELEGSIKNRIHNLGKDSNGAVIGIRGKRQGKYSPGYERVKAIAVNRDPDNRNVYPINLQLNGDLLRQFTVGTQSGKPVLKFQTDLEATKAAAHELNYKTEIHRPSESELDDGLEVLIIGLKEFLMDHLGN